MCLTLLHLRSPVINGRAAGLTLACALAANKDLAPRAVTPCVHQFHRRDARVHGQSHQCRRRHGARIAARAVLRRCAHRLSRHELVAATCVSLLTRTFTSPVPVNEDITNRTPRRGSPVIQAYALRASHDVYSLEPGFAFGLL